LLADWRSSAFRWCLLLVASGFAAGLESAAQLELLAKVAHLGYRVDHVTNYLCHPFLSFLQMFSENLFTFQLGWAAGVG
jgi:hypothetical protein